MDTPLEIIKAAEQEAKEALDVTNCAIAATEELISNFDGILQKLREKRSRQMATIRALAKEGGRANSLEPVQQELFPDLFPES